MTARCLGAILAGGAGSRVGGADKGLLTLRGRPLIAHVVEALRPQCDALLIVANRNLDQYADFAVAVSDETQTHAGPLAGLISALSFCERAAHPSKPYEWLLTAPVDCPQPPYDLRARLQTSLMRSRGGALCAFARDDGGAQPLFALYRLCDIASLLRSARAALASHASALQWQRDIAACAVDFSDRSGAFHNLNTLRDFHDYGRAHG